MKCSEVCGISINISASTNGGTKANSKENSFCFVLAKEKLSFVMVDQASFACLRTMILFQSINSTACIKGMKYKENEKS